MVKGLYAFFRWLVRWYHPSRTFGAPIPAEGPLVLVSNHTNGLVDATFLTGLSQRTPRFLAKFKLFRVPVLGRIIRWMDAIPIYRQKDKVDMSQNESSFQAIYDRLAAGGVITVFPEGSSHSEPRLQRLKTGAARMALGAEASRGFDIGVRIVPVGIFYAARDAWRSRVDLWVGEPLSVRELRDEYEQDEWGTVQLLTDRIADALREVTLNLERKEDRRIVELADEIFGEGEDPQPKRLQALARGLEWLREHRPEREQALVRRALDFEYRMNIHGLRAANLDHDRGPGWAFVFILRALVILVIGMPLFALGALVWGLPVVAGRLLARLPSVPADKFETVLLLSSLVLVPLWWGFMTGLAWSFIDFRVAVLVGVGTLLLGILLPPLWDRRRAALGDLAVLLNLAPKTRLHQYLRKERDEIADEMRALLRLVRVQSA